MSDGFSLEGRVLFLSQDPELLKAQLAGGERALGSAALAPLRDRVSTDEITPAWACYYFDATLARYCLVGLAGGAVEAGDVQRGGFEVLVAGESFGYGSSRETAPFSLKAAGIRLIIAASVEKIFLQNCQNLGIYVSTDFGLLPRLLRGERVETRELLLGLDGLARDVVAAGGLFAYNARRLRGGVAAPPPSAPPRAMTLVEKLIAAHVVGDRGELGVRSVAPGESYFVRADLRFSHDYVTAMADSLFRQGFGEDAQVAEPESLVLFRDHLTLLGEALTPRHRELKLYDHALELKRAQERFAERHSVRLFDEVAGPSGPRSYGICHNVVLDELGLPGTVIIGTDSHTCTAGALGALAFGVGSTDMANAFLTRDARLRVPETVKVELVGALLPGVAAKDVMLRLLASPEARAGAFRARVLEFGGPGVASLNLDERATLTNMAVEASAFTGVVPFDARAAAELSARRGVTLSAGACADPGAQYAAVVTLDLSELEPMISLPGDPRNGMPLREAERGGPVRIDIAYGGSCTGSKATDIDAYAAVLGAGLGAGLRVAEGVRLYIQLGSLQIRRYAEERGYLELFERAGAIVLEPACGACIGSGPGISTREDEVTVSAVNRNFPGRSGPGRVYLASPWVVAASALAGHLAAPSEAALPTGAQS
ncbi:MAG: 3-isopropylmalate dehydratase [Myxococcales bacterium]|nr:MAG: 3-isopropylmalate dehydratase [Myxococcales bacterium]